MERMKISLVTPSLNQGRFLERSVVSVLGQRYPKLEYILIDGGSTDATADVLRRYQRHFAYLEALPGIGVPALLQQGFARATGEILAIAPSDGMLAPGALDYVAWLFGRDPRLDMVYSHRIELDEANRTLGYRLLPPHRSAIMRRVNLIPPETVFFRRSLYERTGDLDAALGGAALYDLFVRFMAIGRLHRADRFLAAHRRHAESRWARLDAAYETDEIAQIRQRHNLPRQPWWEFLAWRAAQGSQWRGERFARNREILPGALPGIGYDYDKVWGGTLTGPHDVGV